MLSRAVSQSFDFTNKTHPHKNLRLICGAARSLLPLGRHNQGAPMKMRDRVIGHEEKLMEVRLWQAVVVTTIQEWVSGPLRRKREAEDYLFRDQRDFPLVCQSAGLDVGRLRSKLARLKPLEEFPASKWRLMGTLSPQE
jgi:hypothetical protein